MKTRFFKYWLCCLMLCIAVLGGGNSAAFAVSGNIDNTPVMQDLKGSTIDGEPFDVANYPYNENGKVKLLVFTEFCFSYKASLAGNYALYVYAYNPTGKTIREDKNSIQLASVFEGDKPTRYKKYDLKFCNRSDGAYDKLFYKFRVIDDGSIYERVCKDNTARRYYVSGIELNYTGTAEDFKIGNKWIFSGFAKGCGADENAESTLSCLTNGLDTVSLKVTDTYYRHNKTQISSVYFALDNALIKKHGTLQKIHAEWLQARTSDIIVMKDNGLYDKFKDYIGVDIGARNNNLSWYMSIPSGVGGDIWGYNLGTIPDYMSKLTYLFNASSTNGVVSSVKMKEYVKWYSDKFGKKTVAGKYNADLFSQVDDKKTDVTIDADSHFDINGFTSGSEFIDWFHKLFNTGVDFDDLKDNEPIHFVTESDFQGSSEEISKRLLVTEIDLMKLRADYELNKKLNKTTVLFRFAVSEYSSIGVNVCEHKPLTFPQTGKAFKSSETVYLDFDIIDLTFVKKDVATVVPVVSNPIDVIAGIDPPPSTDTEPPWWVWLILGILCLVLLLLLFLFVKPFAEIVLLILKAVWTIVSAPFRLIIWLCRKIFNRGAK